MIFDAVELGAGRHLAMHKNVPYKVHKMALSKRITARFFKTPAGNEPVRDWLHGLEDADRKIVGTDLGRVEYGWPVGMPVCSNVRPHIYEVRSTIKKGKVEARTYFAIDGSMMLLLWGSSGKTKQDHDINMALDNYSEYKRNKPRKKKKITT